MVLSTLNTLTTLTTHSPLTTLTTPTTHYTHHTHRTHYTHSTHHSLHSLHSTHSHLFSFFSRSRNSTGFLTISAQKLLCLRFTSPISALALHSSSTVGPDTRSEGQGEREQQGQGKHRGLVLELAVLCYCNHLPIYTTGLHHDDLHMMTGCFMSVMQDFQEDSDQA